MTDPEVAIFMLGIFVLVILLGFPICFTLVAMGFGFGYYAYATPTQFDSLHNIFNNRVFDLLVNQTYSVMINDVLVAVPLFLFMGYVVERANIVDRLFYTLNIAARRVPGSMAVAALLTCAIFATASGIIGAVVTLMGLLAFPALWVSLVLSASFIMVCLSSMGVRVGDQIYSVWATLPSASRAALNVCQARVAHLTRMGNSRTPAKTASFPRAPVSI